MASNIHYQRADYESGLDENSPLITGLTGRKPELKSRDGTASAMATFGLGFSIMWAQALIRWFASPTEFQPAPILGPDVIEPWRLVSLRIFEALSVGVLLAHIWYCVLVPAFPYLRNFKATDEPHQFTLDGRHVLGGLVALCADGFLNCHQYIFMWNANSINRGVWAKFLPFHNHLSSSRYGESLLWGPPMYVYFCAGFGILGCNMAKPLRKRFPDLSNAGIFTIIWCIEFVMDFVIENLAIRITHGYGYAKTYRPLTLFPEQVHQFPIYESVFVASLGLVFTAMRLKAYDTGRSPVEAGFEIWHPSLQGTVRTFAVIGFSAGAVLIFYHLPLNWLGVIGDCYADMPSYMKPGPVE
ncbi:hypothetical protein B0J13DRAFT_531038 [Dactylonectria estremocensis]|uniref:Uncharacterized protein n=1 Tax=Dactylonectria estremocensis TaxID=1079267 RepID=A0A9P9IPF9_9HYPO|nr:hypothetical protein B0J13DRAFT_531038 [Dactylonectria estremocensis]